VIQKEGFRYDNDAIRPIAFWPAPAKSQKQYILNAGYCDLIFNLFYKEMILSGYAEVGSVLIAELYSNRAMLSPSDVPMRFDPNGTIYKPLMFYPDFHPQVRQTDRFPFQYLMEDMEQFILHLFYEHNIGPVFQSCIPLTEIDRWWSPKFLGVILSDCMLYEIEAPK
jgi:hypothetical protein